MSTPLLKEWTPGGHLSRTVHRYRKSGCCLSPCRNNGFFFFILSASDHSSCSERAGACGVLAFVFSHYKLQKASAFCKLVYAHSIKKKVGTKWALK